MANVNFDGKHLLIKTAKNNKVNWPTYHALYQSHKERHCRERDFTAVFR